MLNVPKISAPKHSKSLPLAAASLLWTRWQHRLSLEASEVDPAAEGGEKAAGHRRSQADLKGPALEVDDITPAQSLWPEPCHH